MIQTIMYSKVLLVVTVTACLFVYSYNNQTKYLLYTYMYNSIQFKSFKNGMTIIYNRSNIHHICNLKKLISLIIIHIPSGINIYF